jgi:hypothetical protein
MNNFNGHQLVYNNPICDARLNGIGTTENGLQQMPAFITTKKEPSNFAITININEESIVILLAFVAVLMYIKK